MSDDEPKDESTDDSEQQADEQATDSDQSAGQAEEQPVESDQTAEQTEDQAATSDESAEQLVEQSAESDQTTEQSEGQPYAESDQSAGQPDEATGGGGGGGGGGSGGGVGGGGPADDAVAADSGKKLQVTAEFTQEGGQKFLGDIKLSVYEYDEQKGQQGVQLFGGAVQDWQLFEYKKPSSITTPMLRVANPVARVSASARVIEAGGDGIHGVGRSMQTHAVFDFRMPKGDTLLAKFDVELGNVNEIIPAPTAEAAKSKVMNYPEFKTKVMRGLDAQPSGKQTPPQFRVTGKFYTGHLSLAQANAQAAA